VLILAIMVGGVCHAVPRAMAAEILSIRSATLLQVGDQNRSYGVQLACVEVSEAQSQEALSWLQQHGARGTKVNLRPISNREGRLVAKVSVLKTGLDLGDAMVNLGLATLVPCLQEEGVS
jgi:endonuclease YncB( thermonuclease family)